MTSHFFREFTSKLQLEINKQQVTGGNLTDISEMRGRAGAVLQQRRQKQIEEQEAQMRVQQSLAAMQPGAQIPGSPTMQRETSITKGQKKQGELDINSNSQSQGSPIRALQAQIGDTSNAFQALYSIVSRDMDGSMRKVDLINAREMPLKDQNSLKQKNTLQGGTMEAQGGSINQRPTGGPSLQEETFREVVHGSQNIILKGIMKMLDEKLKQTGNPSVAQIQNQKQLKKLNLSNVQNNTSGKQGVTNRSQRQPKNLMPGVYTPQEILAKKEEIGFLKIGDIILINYDEKVYDQLNLAAALRNEIPGVELDIDHILERANANENLRAKITQDPDLIYKGMIFSDGVTDKNFQILPRHLTNQMSAFTNFKKCLFRIEIAMDCKFNTIKQHLIDELLELEHQRSQLNEQKALKKGQGGSMRRGNKEIDEIDRLDREIERIEKEIIENDKVLVDEIKNNEYEFKLNLGKKINYGQRIQFKHLFSGQYLTLNTRKISHEHGCVGVTLSEPNENSWFVLLPSEKIKHPGQSVSYLDNFYIQNYVKSSLEKPQFYIHVNNRELLKIGEETVCEVNASFEPTQFKARLFISHGNLKYDKNHIESGDVVRLMHKEANGYLTTFEKDVELGLPPLPDFLARQVAKYPNSAQPEKTIATGGKVVDLDQLEQKRMIEAQKYEKRKRNQQKVFIERDLQRLQYTNSCWEIQKVQTFKGGPILMNDACRLRHIGSGKYLAISATDKRELTLVENSDNTNTLFTIHRDTYRPPNRKTGHQNPLDRVNGDVVIPYEMIIIETFQGSFVHLSENIEEDFSMNNDISSAITTAEGIIKTRTNKKIKQQDDNINSKDQKKDGGKKAAEKEAGGAAKSNNLDLHEDPFRIEPLLGYFSKDDPQKMIFILETVPENNSDSRMGYQAASYYRALFNYFCFLNLWAVIEVDEEELEILQFNGVQLDMIDKYKYDLQTARETDGDLLAATEDIELNVINELIRSISRAKEAGQDHYALLQRNLAEQGILIMMIKLLELMYFKVTPQAKREKDLLQVEIPANYNEDDDCPENIACEMLDPLAEKILRLLHMLIKQNKQNSERVTKYESIFYMMLNRYDAKQVSKIYKETYKRAQIVMGDGEEDGGAAGSSAIMAEVGGSISGSSGFGSAMKKWVDRLETIRYENESNENISKQILYLNVISMMCRDAEGKGIFQYQVQAIANVLSNPKKVPPITFNTQPKTIDRPIVYIWKSARETDEEFLKNNPLLRDIWKPSGILKDSMNASSIVLDLFELTQKNIASNGRLQPYIDWIAAVINMYCHMSLSRNHIAINKLKEMGLKFNHILAAVAQLGDSKKRDKNKEKIEPLDKKLIAAYILASKVMYIDNQLFPSLYTYHNRCYFWETVHNSDAHKTMYRWEKPKFFRGFEENNRFQKEETEQHENLAMGQLREHVYQFFSGMPEVLQSFLYSFESRRYTKKDVISVLTLMFNYIDTAASLIESELVDSKFIYRMLQAAAVIFVSYHYEDMPNTEEDKSWVYMVLQVAKKTKRCKEKVEILEFKTLKLLEIICKFRLNAQILIFLQLFRTYVEKNMISHVSQNTSSFDTQFQVIFQLYQFNIGKNLTFKTLERIKHSAGISIFHATKAYQKQMLNKTTTSAQNSQLAITGDNTHGNSTMVNKKEVDPEELLLRITDIVLTEIKDDGNDEEEVNDEGEVIKRGAGDQKKTVHIPRMSTARPSMTGILVEEPEDDLDLNDSQIGMADNKDRFRRAKQFNDKYEIDKFLLYLIFAKKTNRGMRNQAVKVLVQNFNQRELLMHELTKIELIISSQDQDYYNYFQQQQYMITSMIVKVHQLAVMMKAAGGNGRAGDVLTYQSIIDNLVFILKGLTRNLTDHVDLVRISEGDELFIQQETARLVKKQNMLRHMGITKDLIDDLMEKIIDAGFFKPEQHVDLYKEISRFLFMYCFENLANERTLIPYLNFFVQLTDVDVPTPKLVSMILSQQKETEAGLAFLNFLTEKVLHTLGDNYKSQIFNLLTLMMTRQTPKQEGKSSEIVNIESNQIFVLKRLVKKGRFRKLLLMDEKNSAKKLDLIASLNQRIKEQKSFTNMTKADQKAYTYIEWEALKLHLAVVDLVSATVRGCIFGRMQARKLITGEVLFDSIMSEATPFLVKRKYLRLLFETYVRTLPEDNVHIDFNTPMFRDFMFYIVLEDLRNYARYYLGLIVKQGEEDQRDNDLELQRKRAMEWLAQKSIEDTRKRNMERTRQEMENFKEARSKLSTLSLATPVPLIDDTEKAEYWKYLSQYKKSRKESDGLLHFITDFYKNVRKGTRKMSKEMIEVSVKIKDVLMDLSDDLHKINEMYADHVTGITKLVQVIDQALQAIPDVKNFKSGQKFDVKGGAGQAQVLVEDDDDDEENDPLKQEERIKKQQEADESRQHEIAEASDKIINIIRDTIINDGTTIRQFFGIKSFEKNYIMRKLDLKKLLKNILGSQASNDEIEMFMIFLDNHQQDETEQRRTIQPDIATEGYIKTRIDPLKVLTNNDGYSFLFNFRDLENMLKKALQKLQYKPPVQKRAKDELVMEININQDEDELSRACNLDLKIFTKCFFDFFQRFKHSDEISDIVSKIVFMFNTAYEDDQDGVVKKFIQNMVQGFHSDRDRLYMLRIFNRLVDQYLPSNPENKNIIKAKERLGKLQITMKDCGLLQLLLKLVNKDNIVLADEAIKMLSNLLCDSNLQIQNALLDLMKENRSIFQFFSYLKNRLEKSSDFLIKEMESKLLLRQLQVNEAKYHQDPRIDSLYNKYQQPFYVPSQDKGGQGYFSLESEVLRLSSLQNSAELMNILKFLQMVCDNCHQGFQDYLRNQEENALDTVIPLTTVNIVAECGNILIKLTEKLGNLIFSEFIIYETIQQLFETLIDFVIGPNVENQKLLGSWKKFCKAVNFYLEQNMGLYQPNTTEQRAKLSIMGKCTNLIRALSESIDIDFKSQILAEMVPEINVKNLKNKMVEIFHYKIGTNPEKQRIYYSNKKCKHYQENTLTQRKNICEKGEFCQFGHLINFDKSIILAGFDIFIFLYSFKEVDPGYEYLQNFDSDFKNESIYRYKYSQYQQVVNEIVNISAERQAEAVVLNDLEIEEEVVSKTEQLLLDLNIKRPTGRIFPEIAKKLREQDLGNEEDQSGNIENQIFEGESEEQRKRQDKANRKKVTAAKRITENRRRWCWGKCGPKVNAKVADSKQNSGNNQSHHKVNESVDEHNGSKNRYKAGGIEGLLDDEGQDGVQSLMEVFYEKADKYTLEQFMLDAAIRFYISNVAEIEIDYNGVLTKVMFRIPPYCTFLSKSTQTNMIYEANHDSHIEKLEEFFNKKRVYAAEMKSIQKLEKKSRFLRWVSQKWKALSNISFGMVLLINLIFIVFYKIDNDAVTMQYTEAELAVGVLAIIQAIIAFLVMLSYILRYHGKIHEEYLENFKMSNRDRFSNIKGSLGFAIGSDNSNKVEHASALEQQKKKDNKKDEDNELTRHRAQKLFAKKDLVYSLRIFLIAIKLNNYHAFNVAYFLLSVIGVYYNTVFSFLLLDIVIKIPLLQNVVQAIVQNRKQLFYTMILLFVVIYIYSYLAFRILRESYSNADTIQKGEDAPSENMYCRTLLECFTSTLNNGLRAGGGIGDVLSQISMDKEEGTYWIRYFFDLTFFCLVIILLLNLIFGIIIDAFADMRDTRNHKETDVKERCFICGLNRFEFETKNKSWLDHITKEHSAYAYLYFILYVQAKPGNQCNGVEKFVKSLIIHDDPSFFPVGRCLSLNDGRQYQSENNEEYKA